MSQAALAPIAAVTAELIDVLRRFNQAAQPAILADAAHAKALRQAGELLESATEVVSLAVRAQQHRAGRHRPTQNGATRNPRATLMHLLVDAGCTRSGAERLQDDEAVAVLGGSHVARMLVAKARETDQLLKLHAPAASGGGGAPDLDEYDNGSEDLHAIRERQRKARLAAIRAEATVHVSAVLAERMPSRNELPILFAEAANDVFYAVRSGASHALREVVEELPGAESAHLDEEYAIKKTMVETCPPSLASKVVWKAPQEHVDMHEIMSEMGKAQGELMRCGGARSAMWRLCLRVCLCSNGLLRDSTQASCAHMTTSSSILHAYMRACGARAPLVGWVPVNLSPTRTAVLALSRAAADAPLRG